MRDGSTPTRIAQPNPNSIVFCTSDREITLGTMAETLEIGLSLLVLRELMRSQLRGQT